MLISIIKYISFLYVLTTLIIFIYKHLINPKKAENAENIKIEKLGSKKYNLSSLPHLFINIICLIFVSFYIRLRLYWYFIIIIFIISFIGTFISAFKYNQEYLTSSDYTSSPEQILMKKLAGILYLFTLILWIYSWVTI